MSSNVVRLIAAISVVALASCSGFPTTTPLQNPLSGQGSSRTLTRVTQASQIRFLCPPPADSRRMRCFAIARTDVGGFANAGYHGDDIARAFSGACDGKPPYCPKDLQDAYKLPSKTAGKGTTIAIVDAFGYKAIPKDFATYRSTFGLKACPLGSCFKIVNQEGKSSPLPPETTPPDDWHGEQALDVDMASAICPNCDIVLVQANDDHANNLFTAVLTAAKVLHAHIISTSFGGNEFAASDPHFSVSGVTYVASSGDSGAGAQQPCSFSTVVCVGGTELGQGETPRGWYETVWNTLRFRTQCGGPCGATGSGCSAIVPIPSWQAGFGCSIWRAEVDVSADASVNTPVAVYSSPEGGWGGIGGTSASAPIIAGVFGLAGNAAKIKAPEYVWTHRTSLFDVVAGDNVDPTAGVRCPLGWPAYICHARAGYDGPTGWGTPNGIGSF